MESFSNTSYRSKMETSLPSGGCRPRTTCGGGRRIAFKWPGRPPDVETGEWGELSPATRLNSTHAGKIPRHNRKREKERGKNSLTASGTLENRRQNGQKINFPWRFSNVNLKIFSRKFHILMIFSPNEQLFASRFLNLF